MDDTQAMMATAAAMALSLALFAGWRERRRARRAQLDRVGFVDWPTVQILALIAMTILVGLAFHPDALAQ